MNNIGWKSYYELCKPKVVMLIIFTAVVGMFLSVPGMVPWQPLIFGTIGIGLAASSAAAINHFLDQKYDAKMARTKGRPLPHGDLNGKQVMGFALTLGFIAMAILVFLVNELTAFLTFLSLIGYAVVYTIYLKHATPQNIVIGGAAGAAPPVLGWCAVTGTIDPHALLLFLIIFIWTPPHFWALAVARRDEYAKADIPMLPVTHGADFTRLHIVFYTVLLILVSILPFLTGMSGLFYLIIAVVLGFTFLYYAVLLKKTADDVIAMKAFWFSIVYLMVLFAALLIDHYI
ncbi:MAG: protoheme IX farnesyltransferase [Cycloclasticus sp.]|nr:protoheme IX farnesyltransferase [Cycloclasticus sp.]